MAQQPTLHLGHLIAEDFRSHTHSHTHTHTHTASSTSLTKLPARNRNRYLQNTQQRTILHAFSGIRSGDPSGQEVADNMPDTARPPGSTTDCVKIINFCVFSKELRFVRAFNKNVVGYMHKMSSISRCFT